MPTTIPKALNVLKALRHAHWSIGAIALAAIVAGLMGYPEQNCEEICTGGVDTGLNLSSITCLVLGGLLFGCWIKISGYRYAGRFSQWLLKLLAAKTGIPSVAFDAVAKGSKYMFGIFKQRAMEMEREEGRQEGLQEGRQQGLQQSRQKVEALHSWIQRQREAGKLTIDESDPPPQ